MGRLLMVKHSVNIFKIIHYAFTKYIFLKFQLKYTQRIYMAFIHTQTIYYRNVKGVVNDDFIYY